MIPIQQLRTGVVMHHQGWTRWLSHIRIRSARAAARNRVSAGSDHIEFTCGPASIHDGSPFTADDVVYTFKPDR